MKRRITVFTFLLLGVTLIASGQDRRPPEGVPVVTGYAGSIGNFQSGKQQVSPTINPILLVPFGERWLIEVEGEFEGEYERVSRQPWERKWEKSLEYGQIDFMANQYATFVMGRFLTPFGIFNERLHPLWIKNLQASPLIFPMGTGSSNGAMVRGGISLSPEASLNYAGYFSAATATEGIAARRVGGSRVSMFFPGKRLEIGYSFQRQLQEERFNNHGVDWTLQLKPVPLDVRGEYGRNDIQGSGYWVETAYRLRQVPVARSFFRNSQAVFRAEQFFSRTNKMAVSADEEEGEHLEEEEEEGAHGALPEVDTRRFTVGWNYYINDGFRVGFNYGRELSSEGNRNVWTVGIAYRWTFSLGGPQ